MDDGSKTFLNVVLSVLAPVIILDTCSTEGPKLWEVGTTWAMVIALALPIGCGVYSLIDKGKVEILTLFGLVGTILTGVVTIYANTGSATAIRPDAPWWYAAKEALIALLLAGAMLVKSRGKDSMLRVFIYTDSVFDVAGIESDITQQGKEQAYDALLQRINRIMAASFIFSAVANFLLALHFLLPVLDKPAAEQALEYNYAVSSMTWWGYLTIAVPLLITMVCIIRYLFRSLQQLTGRSSERIFAAGVAFAGKK